MAATSECEPSRPFIRNLEQRDEYASDSVELPRIEHGVVVSQFLPLIGPSYVDGSYRPMRANAKPV